MASHSKSSNPSLLSSAWRVEGSNGGGGAGYAGGGTAVTARAHSSAVSAGKRADSEVMVCMKNEMQSLPGLPACVLLVPLALMGVAHVTASLWRPITGTALNHIHRGVRRR